MKNKLLVSFLLFAVFVFSFGMFTLAEAQVAVPVPFPTFPAGCSSALGYSVTNGSPCNGTTTATMGPLPGCTTALGYSITNGVPCSGSGVALPYLAGCTSVFGFSTITSQPCNGTLVASVPGTPPPVIVVPGLPTTGAGGNALSNFILLSSSGVIAIAGLAYLVRRSKTA